jgi:hypothetical protein
MKVQFQIDSAAVLNMLQELGQDKQGPFILARGMNLLAKQVQTALRDNLASNLTLRRTAWVKQQVMIRPGTWATKTRLVVKIELSDPGAFLSGFEGGADHIPGMGRKFLAIPNKKVFGNRIMGENNLFKVTNLDLHQTPHGMEGRQRTFILHTKASGTPLIMQNVSDSIKKGWGKKGVNRYLAARILYTLVRSSKRPARLSWYDTANQTVITQQAETLGQVMRDALADAKGK